MISLPVFVMLVMVGGILCLSDSKFGVSDLWYEFLLIFLSLFIATSIGLLLLTKSGKTFLSGVLVTCFWSLIIAVCLYIISYPLLTFLNNNHLSAYRKVKWWVVLSYVAVYILVFLSISVLMPLLYIPVFLIVCDSGYKEWLVLSWPKFFLNKTLVRPVEIKGKNYLLVKKNGKEILFEVFLKRKHPNVVVESVSGMNKIPCEYQKGILFFDNSWSKTESVDGVFIINKSEVFKIFS